MKLISSELESNGNYLGSYCNGICVRVVNGIREGAEEVLWNRRRKWYFKRCGSPWWHNLAYRFNSGYWEIVKLVDNKTRNRI